MWLPRKSGPVSWRQRLRTSTRHLVRTIIGHTDWVRSVVPSDDGRLLASASKDQVLCFTTRFLLPALQNVCDRLLDFGTRSRVNKRWSFGDTITRSKSWFLLRLRHTMPFASLLASRFVHVVAHGYISHCIQNTDRVKKSGAYVATGSRDKTIKLWDTQSGQMLKNLVGCLSALRRRVTDVFLPGWA